MSVIESVNDFLLEHRVDLCQIEDHAGLCGDFSDHGDFEFVVVPVSVRPIARTEYLLVTFRRPLRVVVAMCSAEADAARDVDWSTLTHVSEIPPSIGMIAPVVQAEAFEAKKRMRSAISSVVPTRPSRCAAPTSLRNCRVCPELAPGIW